MISLEKIKYILRLEDIEGYIEYHGAPENEYDSEAVSLEQELLKQPALTEEIILEILKSVWAQSFNLDDADIQKRISHLQNVARVLKTHI